MPLKRSAIVGFELRRRFVVFSSRRRHTRYWRDWSSDVCSSDLKSTSPSASGYETPVDRLQGALHAVTVCRIDALASRLPKRSAPPRSIVGGFGPGRGAAERRVGEECRSRWGPLH